MWYIKSRGSTWLYCTVFGIYFILLHRLVHKRSAVAQKTLGLKGKLLSKKRHAEKATMKKTIAMHQERDNKHKAEDGETQSALPAYLLEREQVQNLQLQKPFFFETHCPEDREATNAALQSGQSLTEVHVQVDRAKVLSNTIKQKRKQKAGKWEVPLPKVI